MLPLLSLDTTRVSLQNAVKAPTPAVMKTYHNAAAATGHAQGGEAAV